MHDHPLYLRTLSDFTRALRTPYDARAVLTELTDLVTRVFDLVGSGVSLLREGRLEPDTASGEVLALERLQQECQAGPGMAACVSGTVEVVPDLRTQVDRWPEWCQAARRAGIGACAAIPMRRCERTLGVVDLYSRGPRAWSPEEIGAAVVMTDMATAYLLNASHHREQAELNEQLQHALRHRLVIEQAKGMLAVVHKVSPEQAYERIRNYARDSSITVHSVSEAVVRLELEI